MCAYVIALEHPEEPAEKDRFRKQLREQFKLEFLASSHGSPDFPGWNWQAADLLGEGGFGIVGLWVSVDSNNNIADVRRSICSVIRHPKWNY